MPSASRRADGIRLRGRGIRAGLLTQDARDDEHLRRDVGRHDPEPLAEQVQPRGEGGES